MSRTIYGTVGQIIHPIESDISSSSSKAKLAALRTSMRGDSRRMGMTWQLLFSAMPKRFLSRNGELTYEERAILTALQLYALHQTGQSTSVNTYSKGNDDMLGDFDVQYRNEHFVVESHTAAHDSFQTHTFDHFKEAVQYLKDWDQEVKSIQSKKDDAPSSPKWQKDLGRSLKELRYQYDDKTAIDRRFNSMVSANTFDLMTSEMNSLIRILRAKSPNTTIDYANLAQDLFWLQASPKSADRVRMAWSQSYYSFNNQKGED